MVCELFDLQSCQQYFAANNSILNSFACDSTEDHMSWDKQIFPALRNFDSDRKYWHGDKHSPSSLTKSPWLKLCVYTVCLHVSVCVRVFHKNIWLSKINKQTNKD